MGKISLILVLALVFYVYKSCQGGIDSVKTFVKEKNVAADQRSVAFNKQLIIFLNNEVSLLKDRTKYDQALNEFKIKDPTFLVLVALIEKTRKGNNFNMTVLEMELSDLIKPESISKPVVRFGSPLSHLGYIRSCSPDEYPDCNRFVLYLKKNNFSTIFKNPIDGTQKNVVDDAINQRIERKDIQFLKLYKEYFPEEFSKIINQ